MVKKILFGFFFTIILPFSLLLWTAALDQFIHIPVPEVPLLAVIIILFGACILIKGMYDLFTLGKGLPMNAFPPKYFVKNGIYKYFSDPIYLGAVFLVFGISLYFRSSAGIFVAGPVFTIGVLSYIYGFEKVLLQQTYKKDIQSYRPYFSLPESTGKTIPVIKRLILLFSILLPCFFSVYLLNFAQCGTWCNNQIFIGIIVCIVSTIIFLVNTGRNVRITLEGTILFCLFHVFFSALLPVYGIDNKHNPIIQILFYTLLFFLTFFHKTWWHKAAVLSEIIGNSRKDWLFLNGHFRIINHSIYSYAAGAIGTAIAAFILGNNALVLFALVVVMAGATVFAQLLWGNNALLRPFGYWGAIIAGAICAYTIHVLLHIPLSLMFLATAVSAPFAQAAGRLRCLNQGCCHGLATTKDLGIRIWNPQSRVVMLSKLQGQYILNTQLYSLIFNALLGLLLLALYLSGSFPSSFITGMYFILTGIERFTEDAYRGEKQTRMLWSIRENQWFAIAALFTGIIITMIPTAIPVLSFRQIDIYYVITILLGGGITAAAMSMDFPTSTLKFSKLSG